MPRPGPLFSAVVPTVTAWLVIIAAAISIVVFAGTIVVYLRGSRDKGTIATLEASNRALTERVVVLESEAARDLLERDRLEARVTALEHENTVLAAARPSAEVIADVAAAVVDIKNGIRTHDDRLSRHDVDTKAMLTALMLPEDER